MGALATKFTPNIQQVWGEKKKVVAFATGWTKFTPNIQQVWGKKKKVVHQEIGQFDEMATWRFASDLFVFFL